MYLPFEPTFLRLLQLPLSLLNSDRSSLYSVVPNEGVQTNNNINLLGTISPYHDAPAVPGVSSDLPEDCTVEQVILLQRHGSRGPYNEQDYILGLAKMLRDASTDIQAADLPPELEFLREGYEYDLVPQELTIIGRKELFNHGVDFALRYPTFKTDQVVTTADQRVIDSAHFFNQGFFGVDADDIEYLLPKNFTDPVFWLRSWEACPMLDLGAALKIAQKWANKYLPLIQERFNQFIPGVEFSLDDVRGALYACPYDLATRNKSPWCDVFTEDELRALEYNTDIYFDHFTGHWYESGPDAGPLAGAFYIKKLIERLSDATENAKPLYLDFAHDATILFALSTLNLNKDAEPLSPLVDTPPADRKFRTSNQAPFAARMVWEKFTCTESFEGPQVRLLLNGVTFPLSICDTDMDEEYGTCSLEAFMEANEYSIDVEYGSETWNELCEPDD